MAGTEEAKPQFQTYAHVMAEWDMVAITLKLAESYREVIAEKRDSAAQ